MEAKHKKIPWNKGKGKGWTDKRGYQWIYVTEYGHRRAKRLHRFIMEEHIGRKLKPYEIVHHKDGNPQNNNINNLELTKHNAHTITHHMNSARTTDIKHSMEVFANFREENKRLKRLISDLLEACEYTRDLLGSGIGQSTHALAMIEAAIAKAEKGE